MSLCRPDNAEQERIVQSVHGERCKCNGSAHELPALFLGIFTAMSAVAQRASFSRIELV